LLPTLNEFLWAIVVWMASVHFTLSLKGILSVCHYHTLFFFVHEVKT